MIQIIGSGLELAFNELKINAIKRYETPPDFIGVILEVWELSDEDFTSLCNIDSYDWKEEYGWWVNGGCNHNPGETKLIVMNGKPVRIFFEPQNYFEDESDDECTEQYFDNLEQYFEEHIGISKYNNKAYYIHSLAELNNMTKAEFMKKFW